MKHYLLAACALSLISSVLIALSLRNKCEDTNAFFEENVEVLSDDEGGVSGVIECNGSGGIYCPIDRKAEYSYVAIYQ